MTPREIADYLNGSGRTIYGLVAAKKVLAFKGGRAWRFLREDIGRWIRHQTSEDPGNGVPDPTGAGR